MEKLEELSYKEAITKLEEIVKKMEQGDPDVDELGVMVEEALLLLKKCKNKLRTTEDNIKRSFEEHQ